MGKWHSSVLTDNLPERKVSSTRNVIEKKVANENTDYHQNNGNDDYDQSEATENECEDLVNILQNHVSLSFGNKEGISEEKKTMIKNIIQITEHNLDEEVTGFDLLKDWTIKVNAILKEVKSNDVARTKKIN